MSVDASTDLARLAAILKVPEWSNSNAEVRHSTVVEQADAILQTCEALKTKFRLHWRPLRPELTRDQIALTRLNTTLRRVVQLHLKRNGRKPTYRLTALPPASYCVHGKKRYTCKECGGAYFCEHAKQQHMCDVCGGAGMCPHGKQRYACSECLGKGICSHGVHRQSCPPCGGSKVCRGHVSHQTQCHTLGSVRYSGYCVRCFMHLFPDQPVARNWKTKESAVVAHVEAAYADVHWVWDKRIADGCSLRRPDLLCDLGSHVVVVEVDENQHEAYDTSCENKRLMELSSDIGHRPLVLIRFNPDRYVSSDGITHPSCWGTDQRGISRVKKSKLPDWTHRLEVLSEKVGYWLTHATERTVTIESLFFDSVS